MNLASMLADNIRKSGEFEQMIHLGAGGKIVRTNLEINRRAGLLASGLGGLGASKGDVVAAVISNIPEIPEIMNGVMRLGAIYLPVVFMLTPPEIKYILDDSEAGIIITEQQLLPKVKEAAAGKPVKIVVVGGAKEDGIIPYEELMNSADTEAGVVDVDDDELAMLMYTSGTTGFPKGVMLSHGNLFQSMKSGSEVWPYEPGDRGLITVPMNHIYGVLGFHEACYFDTSYVIVPWFDPVKTLEIITEYKINVMGLVPTMIMMMMQVWDPAKYDMSSVKLMISAGAPLSGEALKKAQKLFGVTIFHGYGCTEAGPTIARQRKDRHLKHLSVGPAIPGLELKLVDENGQEVEAGEEGEIICRGPGIMKGYWKKPKETAAALVDGWLYTGDMGRLDEDNELFVTGRKKDLIIKGGENIDPGKIENLLMQHPAVQMAAVVAIPDEKYGEEVGAAVVLNPGQKASEKELIDFLGDKLHHFVTPKRILFFDALPISTVGKVLKREIRRIAAEEMGA